MSTNLRKKIFLFVFCLASITQGMYSTYFVGILTTIESIYQIKSKTAGALLSATELGQIFGSLFIAYYGGRGNKPRWIAACMTLSAFAALISVSPHFIPSTLNNQASSTSRAYIYQSSNTETNLTSINQINGGEQSVHAPASASSYRKGDLDGRDAARRNKSEAILSDPSITAAHQLPMQATKRALYSKDYFCRWESLEDSSLTNKADLVPSTINYGHTSEQSTHKPPRTKEKALPTGLVIVLFFLCLLVIGFGSTAITTLGIPFIDDIISKEESPLYLGLTISLKTFGPALGFLLSSLCIHLRLSESIISNLFTGSDYSQDTGEHGAWWLGLILISIPLLVLSIPMYYLSKSISSNQSERDDFEDITYQAAEDHDIGGSHDFAPHMLTLANDTDLTSNRTCLSSEIDSSSREALQASSSPAHQHVYSNYVRNLTMEKTNLNDDKSLIRQSEPQGIAPVSDDHSENGAIKTLRQEVANRWDNGVCIIVNHFGRLEATRYSNKAQSESSQPLDLDSDQAITCNTQNQTQRPPPPSSSRSSFDSSFESSISNNGDDNGKVRDRKRRKGKAQSMAGLSQSLERLLSNRLLILRILSNILHIMPIAGFFTFLPKYLTQQYRMTLSSASAISALAGILFVGLGAFLGGTIVRVFNVNSKLMTRWIASSALLYSIGMLVLMNLGCESNHIVHHTSREFLETDCSSSCKCSSYIYDPVCANGTTYLSPCLAGCRNYSMLEDRIIYDECGCMTKPESLPNISSTNFAQPNDHVNLNVASQGFCPIECSSLIWYIVVFSASTLIHASCEVGSMMFNLRCVKTNDRTLALGLVTFASSLLGTIPCSVIYGTVVDMTCVFWDTIEPTEPLPGTGANPEVVLDLKGACRVYDNGLFRIYLHGVTALVMLFAFLVDCIISCRSNEVDFYDRSDSKADIRLGLKKSTETI